MVMETQLVSPGGDDVQLLDEGAAGESDRRIGKRGVISEGLGSGVATETECNAAWLPRSRGSSPWQLF